MPNNCTTNIAALAGEPQWDWRVLLNGHADQMLYQRGDLATGNLPFAQLKAQAHINAAARAAGDGPDFSRRIRGGLASLGPTYLPRTSATFGYVTSTPKAGWQNYKLAGPVRDAPSVPVGFDTDVDAAALGETRWGAAQNLTDFLYL